MFGTFLRLYTVWSKRFHEPYGVDMEGALPPPARESYHSWKSKAKNYQAAKAMLKTHMGGWMGNSQYADHFFVQDDSQERNSRQQKKGQ